MSAIQLYRRAIARLVVCLLLTMIDGLVAPVALYCTFGHWGSFSIVLLLLVPFALTLGNVWHYTVTDIKLTQDRVAGLELGTVNRTA